MIPTPVMGDMWWEKETTEQKRFLPPGPRPDNRYAKWKKESGLEAPQLYVVETAIYNLLCHPTEHKWVTHTLKEKKKGQIKGNVIIRTHWSFDHCPQCGSLRLRDFFDPSPRRTEADNTS